jgi:hypothetical protein
METWMAVVVAGILLEIMYLIAQCAEFVRAHARLVEKASERHEAYLEKCLNLDTEEPGR